MKTNEHEWPIFKGDYLVNNFEGRIAIATLNDDPKNFRGLLKHKSVSIIGSVKTENLGIEKIIANVISNPNIRFLIICGTESKGHFPGQALISLFKNGVDENSRIIGAKGAIPYLENVDRDAVERFREQISGIMDEIGSCEVERLEEIVRELEKRNADRYPGPPVIIKGIGKKKEKRIGSVVEKLDKLVVDAVTCIDPLDMKVIVSSEGV